MGAESSWTRYPRTKTAVRGENGDRITLMQQRGQWIAFIGKDQVVLDAGLTLDLDDAVDLVDKIYTPDGWNYETASGAWLRPGWSCTSDDAGEWHVYRSDVPGAQAGEEAVAATTRTFKSADRARRWAEIRLDRTTLNLRGPRPRATQRANMTLPDVRVTEAERTSAVQLALRLGLSYSDLARAAIELIRRECCDSGALKLTRTGMKVLFVVNC
jgi:hypothetical protein